MPIRLILTEIFPDYTEILRPRPSIIRFSLFSVLPDIRIAT